MGKNRIDLLKEILEEIRGRWKEARSGKMEYKQRFLDDGADAADIRKDKGYREHRKEQKKLSVRMKHLVKEINRRSSKLNETK